MPVLVATALAYVYESIAHPVALFSICISAVSIQIATNLHNDAQDFLNGTDTEMRVGPTRITQSGSASPEQTRNAAWLFFIVALVCGSYLVWLGGTVIAIIGILSILSGYAYSAGPWPISRSPLGEVFVLVFFGIIAVSASGYLLSGVWIPESFLYGIVVGCPASAVLLLNNYRDSENDAKTGRKTLSILLRPRASIFLYVTLMLLPFGILYFITPNTLSMWLPMLALVIVFFTLYRILTITHKSDLNTCLAMSAGSQIAICLLLCAGLILDFTTNSPL